MTAFPDSYTPPFDAALELLAAPLFEVCDEYLRCDHPHDLDAAVYDAVEMVLRGQPLAHALELFDPTHPAAFEVGKRLVALAQQVYALQRTWRCL